MQEVATHTDCKALYEESQLVIARLRHGLDQLKKMIFGSGQSRFVPGRLTDPTRLSLGLPDRPLPKATGSHGLSAQIIIDKNVDHLPLHREQQRFSREKINIPYSTLTDWVGITCKLHDVVPFARPKSVLESVPAHSINNIGELFPNNY